MKIVAVVQARVTSTRLPAKVMLDLGGKTVLERCLRRVARIAHVDEVLVATTDRPEDDVTAALARRLGFRSVRGSENDVLSRYALALRETKADAVVRCTSDCPLLDPDVSSLVVDTFRESQVGLWPFDYVSNTLKRKLPRGLDTEIIRADVLERADCDATDPAEREHVTLHVYRRPGQFRCGCILPRRWPDWSKHRWTLDTLADYRFLCAVYDELGAKADDASMHDVMAVLERCPEIAAINTEVPQKPLSAPYDLGS